MSQSVDYHSPFTPAEEILERSKSASLNIVAITPDHMSRRVQLLKTILTRMSRIERLSLNYHQSDGKPIMIDKLLRSVVSPAPLLESLHLHFRDRASLRRLYNSVDVGSKLADAIVIDSTIPLRSGSQK
jgi:hypothetical protein